MKHWPTKKLGEVCDLYQPKTITSKEIKSEGHYKVFGANGVIGYYDKYNHEESEVLVTCRGATCGTVNMSEPKSWITGNAMVVHPKKENISKKFLFFLLKAIDIDKAISGSAQPQITRKSLSPIEIPLPSLSEQKRIVEKIEKLFAKIDEAERLRAESLAASAALLPSALHQLFIKIKKKWKSDKIGNIVLDFRSGFACSKRATGDKGIPQLRPNNIGFNGKIDLSNLVFIPQKLVNQEKYKLKKGDVLFNNTNSKELVGRAVLVERNLKYVFSNHITRIKVNPKVLFPEWLVVNINYLWEIGYFLDISQKWIGQAGVNTQMLKSTEIFIPPLSEQKKIVAYLDALSQKSRELQKLRQQTAAGFYALHQSILAQAFNQNQ